MDRRAFIQTTLGALAAGSVPAQTPPAASARKLKVDAWSGHLQWLRSPDEVAQAVAEMGFDGVNLTVGAYPAHIDPAQAATALPQFVNGVRKHGLRVTAISTSIVDADSPGSSNVEQILSAAHSAGITHYSWGPLRYEPGKPVLPQLEALKPHVERLAKLSEKYKLKGVYSAGLDRTIVGAATWDMLSVLRGFDPSFVSLLCDVGDLTVAGGGGVWALDLRAAGPFVGGVAVKDQVLENALVVSEGGPFTGSPAPPGGRGGGRGRGGAPGVSGAAGASGGRGGRGGPPAGFAGFGGGRGGASGNATPATWRERQVLLGTGMDNLPEVADVLKEIDFDGPVQIRTEYPNGGAETGQDKITLPRAWVLGAMKRDLLNLKSMWAASGLL
jgi:L-ribulose-5-phosphate 3-epimerase